MIEGKLLELHNQKGGGRDAAGAPMGSEGTDVMAVTPRPSPATARKGVPPDQYAVAAVPWIAEECSPQVGLALKGMHCVMCHRVIS